MTPRVVVVEDHRIVREGLRSQLEAADFAIAAEVESGAKAIEAAETHRPELVLLDLRLPDRAGAEICREILARTPETAVVVLSAYGDQGSVRTAVDAGARAYLLKDAEELDLPDALRRVLAGESVLDPRAAAALLRSQRAPEVPKLSDQELNVLRLAAEGFTNPQIGTRLYLSRHTVKEYLSNAMRKLEVTSRVEAVMKASSLGLIEGRSKTAPDRTGAVRTLVYNETGGPARASDLKIAALKVASLQDKPQA
jgi:DNA-binding NarL/FixJ family response regulator